MGRKESNINKFVQQFSISCIDDSSSYRSQSLGYQFAKTITNSTYLPRVSFKCMFQCNTVSHIRRLHTRISVAWYTMQR